MIYNGDYGISLLFVNEDIMVYVVLLYCKELWCVYKFVLVVLVEGVYDMLVS